MSNTPVIFFPFFAIYKGYALSLQTRLRIESVGRVVPGVTVEPLPRHPFHEVRQHRPPPCRKPFRPLVEQGPAGELFFTVREIRERRNDFLRRPGIKQPVERLDIGIMDIASTSGTYFSSASGNRKSRSDRHCTGRPLSMVAIVGRRMSSPIVSAGES
jgi:hypothetical protein